MLGETGQLRHDHDLAHASQSLGSVLMLLALAWGAVALVRSWRHREAH